MEICGARRPQSLLYTAGFNVEELSDRIFVHCRAFVGLDYNGKSTPQQSHRRGSLHTSTINADLIVNDRFRREAARQIIEFRQTENDPKLPFGRVDYTHRV